MKAHVTPEEFRGECHTEQTIRLFAVNETPDLSSVGVVLNGRGGPYAGGYWASNAGAIAIAPLRGID